jgi:hypothetical protein
MQKEQDGTNLFFNLNKINLEDFEFDMVILSQELQDEEDIGEKGEIEYRGDNYEK